MKISVIIPSHNRRALLGEALDSVRAQTRLPEEIVVIDDRSSDGTAEFVREHYPEVKLVRTDFGNAAAARHAGIEQCSGDWLAFLDSDDLWKPTHLQAAEELLSVSSDVAYLAHRDFFIDKYAETTRFEKRGLPYASPIGGLADSNFTQHFASTRYFPMATLILKKDRYFTCGGFEKSQLRRHDIDLFLRAIHSFTWCYNPEIQASMRVSGSDRISANRLECDYYFLRCLMRCKNLYQNDASLRWLRRRAAAVAAGSAGRASKPEVLSRVFELAGSELPMWRKAYWSVRSRLFR